MYYSEKLKTINPKHIVPILPWGSIEPHGTHLPYDTDSILAQSIANAVGLSVSAKTLYETGIDFILEFDSMPIGSQNPSQTKNYPFCIHFNTETQKAVLDDIVTSLEKQGMNKLFIINGHNGNALKGIIRDLLNKHNGFNIYLCNYLDVIEKSRKRLETLQVQQYELDDHAAFTETSLMLYVDESKVNMQNLKYEAELGDGKGNTGYFWTPRDWVVCSVNSRVGTVGNASRESGEKMFNLVVEELSSEIIKIMTNDKQ